MKYREMGKLGVKASSFGLGCMRFNGPAKGDSPIDEEKAINLIRHAIDNGVTYMDTAYIYLDKTSEITLGRALLDGYRDKVTIATKMPAEYVHNREEMQALLDEELTKLQTDHIDYYLMHGIDKKKWEYFKSIGAPEFFDDMKKEGKIKYKCFSFHGSYEDFEYIINDWDWDMVQIQYNYMDTENQAGEKGLKLAAQKNIPVVIMEPLLGGRLAKAPSNVQALFDGYEAKHSPAEWAFAWLLNHPEVKVVLSGINELDQLDDNIRIFSTYEENCFSEADVQLMKDVKAAYISRTKISCTGCRYCMPCPGGVNIPDLFAAWNESSLYEANPKWIWPLMQLKKNEQTPDKCLECGACEAICPQHLNIIEMLKTAWAELTVED